MLPSSLSNFKVLKCQTKLSLQGQPPATPAAARPVMWSPSPSPSPRERPRLLQRDSLGDRQHQGMAIDVAVRDASH